MTPTNVLESRNLTRSQQMDALRAINKMYDLAIQNKQKNNFWAEITQLIVWVESDFN